jgi:SOS-response transcriptional repressor LexA
MRITAMQSVRSYLLTWGLVVVRDRSMRPTLYDGDRLLVRHGQRPRVGDLVVVRFPDGIIAIKRATFRRDGGWWVERDNPNVGVDSWTVGAIPDADVIAVVRAKVWPPGLSGRGPRRQKGSRRGCIDLDG